MIENLIKDLHESPIFARIFEVGAGVPISNEIFAYPNASKTIYSTESYYAREAFDKAFGKIEHRAVSAERLKYLINDNESIKNEINCGLYNTVLSTTFQVGGKDNIFSTHGWISVNINGKSIRYYHISLHYPMERREYIKTIGEIGIKLLHGQNDFVHESCFVDIVLDENLNPLYKETLEYVSKNEVGDIASVFKFNGEIDRLESTTRNIKNLVVYKGSFNPPSISHKEIVDKSIDLYDDLTKGVFCLSYNTYQKGVQSVDSFLERINFLNKMGYDVLVLNKPLFKNTYDFLRLKYKNKIIFPQGTDTINRMSNDYITFIDREKKKPVFDTKQFLSSFEDVEFLIFKRDAEELYPIVKEKLVDTNLIKIIDSEYTGVSSTIIRNHIAKNEFDKIEKLVPKEVYKEIILKYKQDKNEI